MAQNVELLFPKNFNGSYDVSVQSILIYPFFSNRVSYCNVSSVNVFFTLGPPKNFCLRPPCVLSRSWKSHQKKAYLHIPNPITGLYLFGFVSSFIFFLNEGVVSKVKWTKTVKAPLFWFGCAQQIRSGIISITSCCQKLFRFLLGAFIGWRFVSWEWEWRHELYQTLLLFTDTHLTHNALVG